MSCVYLSAVSAVFLANIDQHNDASHGAVRMKNVLLRI